MTHIAHQRIKVGGLHYAAGDPVVLTERDLAELPEGAASPQPAGDPAPIVTPAAKAALDALSEAVDALKPSDFRQDGTIRSGALRSLNEQLGFEVTAEDVAAVKATGGAGA